MPSRKIWMRTWKLLRLKTRLAEVFRINQSPGKWIIWLKMMHHLVEEHESSGWQYSRFAHPLVGYSLGFEDPLIEHYVSTNPLAGKYASSGWETCSILWKTRIICLRNMNIWLKNMTRLTGKEFGFTNPLLEIYEASQYPCLEHIRIALLLLFLKIGDMF